MPRAFFRRLLLAAALAAASVAGAPAFAAGLGDEAPLDRTEPLPKPLQSVDVHEKLGRQIPATLGFHDENGKPVVLGDYLDGKLPVIFTFNYSDCPMLCSLMLNGLVAGLKELDFTPGEKFRVVTVSIDPKETPERALRTQHRYLADYGRPEAKQGWSFLTGSEANIRAYSEALGLSYAYVPERNEYAHPSALVVSSPNGKIVRYLYGIEYPEQSLRLALLEASEGKIGTAFDRLVLYCFHYDSSLGRYAPLARNIMKVAGAVSIALLAALVLFLSRGEAKRRRRALMSPS